jgi:hypothetical protein
VVDGNPLAEEEAVRDGALLDVMAGGSSSKVLLHLQQKTVVWWQGSSFNLRRWWGEAARDGERQGWAKQVWHRM